MRKKTHEEYVAELALKNPTVEVVGQYINSDTKIMHRCLKHDVCWEISPSNALKGNGCKMCGKEKSHMLFAKTHEQYVLDVKNVNPNIIVVGHYINSCTKILHKCKIDGFEWYAFPSNILKGQGCPKCANKSRAVLQRKTHEQYVNELSTKFSHIEVIGEYVNFHTKILHYCIKHNYYWEAEPASVLNGCGCPKCGIEATIKKTKMSHEEYVERVLKINPNIIVVEEYVNAYTPILHKCKIDGYEWRVVPSSILKGHGCPCCGVKICSERLRKTHKQYVDEVYNINKNIEVVEKYINDKTKILHRCLIDGCEWYTYPTNVLRGCGCPVCSQSHGEHKIDVYLNKHNIEYVAQYRFEDCKDIRPLPFDFYLPHYNICIEYDGRQHFEPVDFANKGKEWAEKQFGDVQKHDKIKTKYCENNNIKLLRIPYFKNIEEELNNFLFI